MASMLSKHTVYGRHVRREQWKKSGWTDLEKSWDARLVRPLVNAGKRLYVSISERFYDGELQLGGE